MNALVDYRNVPTGIRTRGLRYLTDRIATHVTQLEPNTRTLGVRLYSGWGKGRVLTQEAQKLEAEKNTSFPTIRQGHVPLTISLELAQNIQTVPRKTLINKLRLEPIRNGIRFKKPSDTTCRNAHCPIDNLYDFFRDGHCPLTGCAGTVTALADQEQQKLVDTMLVADMIHIAYQGNEPSVHSPRTLSSTRLQ